MPFDLKIHRLIRLGETPKSKLHQQDPKHTQMWKWLICSYMYDKQKQILSNEIQEQVGTNYFKPIPQKDVTPHMGINL